MQPPFHITGDPNADWIIFAIGTFICLYWLRALRLAREGARIFLRNLAFAILTFFGCKMILVGLKIEGTGAAFFSAIAALIVFSRRKKMTRRSRYIPQSVKLAVIERDMKDGVYDSEKHHIDHVWPFSKGGSHTADNLRVIEKRKNLQKGAKRPKLGDMWQ